MKTIEINNRKVSVSKHEGVYTLCLIEKGGPIICDKDFDKALNKFKEALNVYFAVSALITVNRLMSKGASDEEIKEALNDMLK